MKEVSKGTRIINLIVDSLLITILFASIETFITKSIPFLPLIIVCIYYSSFEYFKGQTVGKMVTKTQVVGIDGSKPSFLNILLRTILRFNPFDVFSYLFGNEQGTHDVLSKTKLIAKPQNEKES